MDRPRVLALTLFLILSAEPCLADLILTVGDATVRPGGLFTIDVLGSYTAGSQANLNNFGVEFEIGGGTLATPTFVNTSFGNDPTLNATTYAFTTNSSDIDNQQPFGYASTTNGPPVDFVGGDSTSSNPGEPDTVPLGSGSQLLARLLIQAPSFTVSATGDRYTVSLVLGDNTFFNSDNGLYDNDIGVDPGSKLTGTILVQTTPEPSALVLVLLGAPFVAGWVGVRGRPGRAIAPRR